MDLIRIQKEDFQVSAEVERVKAASKSIGGIVGGVNKCAIE